jgi:PleD family two-component response regulator
LIIRAQYREQLLRFHGFRAALQPTREHTEQAGNVGRRILIADDNEDAARSLAMLLELEGHSVTVVNDGRAALDAFHAARPEVLVLEKDRDKVRALAAGFNHHFTRRRQSGSF